MFNTIFQKLEQAENPVAQLIHKTDSSKVIAIAFKKGMILKAHKTELPAKLLVIKGSVVYKEENKQQTLLIYDEQEIPVDVLHSVEALEDSLCLLFKG